jgi:predicted MPP superfamily phosphohydrolase
MFRSRLTMPAILILLHAFVGVTLIPYLPIGGPGKVVAALLLVLSCYLVPLGFRSRSLSQSWLAWAGLLAMGVFSSLAVFSIVRGIVIAVLMAFPDRLSDAVMTGSAEAVIVLVLLVTLLGIFNARRVARVVTVELPVRNLPAALEGFTIAQISDIHVGPTIRRPYISAIVKRVNGLKADIVAVTGDLVDGSVEQLAEHIAPLAELKGRYGTYVVTGNHEYYSGALAWVAHLNAMGLRVLLNEHVVINHNAADLIVAGITDYSAGMFVAEHRSSPQAAIQGAPANAPKVLLAHQPRSAKLAAEAGFDVQLSGHTHGGQFWPWMHFVRFQQPWVAGIHRLGKLRIYISRGTGYWGPPIRFGAPSEITHIRLIASAD